MPSRRPLTPGERFNRFIVIQDLGTRGGNSRSLVRCDCGKEREILNRDLRYGSRISCGCYNRGWQCPKFPAPGTRFGRLVVIRNLGTREHVSWSLVHCDCGKEFKTKNCGLRRGIISCGCYQRERVSESNRKPLIPGERFGRLVVIRDLGIREHKSWSLVRCDCGKEFEVMNQSLRTSNTISCGCYQRERTRELGIVMAETHRRQKTNREEATIAALLMTFHPDVWADIIWQRRVPNGLRGVPDIRHPVGVIGEYDGSGHHMHGNRSIDDAAKDIERYSAGYDVVRETDPYVLVAKFAYAVRRLSHP